MLCRKCNGEIPEGAAFCPACGTPVLEIPEEKSSTQRYCTKCGTEIPPGENACPKCSEETAEQNTVNAQTSEAQDVPKKKGNRNKILMIVIGVVVAILLVCSETMRVFACLAGVILFPVSLILWIICHVRKKPKKTWGVLMIVAVVLVLVYILFPTKCTQHEWVEATCTEPKTCSKCGETEGEALGHTWIDATCTTPKTCSVCNETEGAPLGHDWMDATYDAPKTCKVCGLTEGSALLNYTEYNEITAEVVYGYNSAIDYSRNHYCDVDYAYNDVRDMLVNLNSAAYLEDKEEAEIQYYKLFGDYSGYTIWQLQDQAQFVLEYVVADSDDILSAMMRKFDTMSSVSGTISPTEVDIVVSDMGKFTDEMGGLKPEILGGVLAALNIYDYSWIDTNEPSLLQFTETGFSFHWNAVGSYKLDLK